MRSRALTTRTSRHGLITRRRLREDGLLFTTIEIPIEIWNQYYKRGNRGRDLMEGWLRRRARTAQRLRAEKLFAQGWKLEAVASDTGVSARTLSDWRKRWKRNALP